MILELIRNIAKEFSTASYFSLICLMVALYLICIYQRFLKARNHYRESIETFISAFFLILLAYSPIINSHFVFADDYFSWSWERGFCYTHPQYLFILGIGRPIANILLCPLWSIVNSLESANFARLVSIVLTSIVFFIVNKFLIYLKFNRIFSYLIALTVVTSFPFQVYNYWITASYIQVGIIFSILSIFLAVKLIDFSRHPEGYLSSKKKIGIKIFLCNKNFRPFYIFSIILYILSLSTYQPSAGFFTCFAAIYILKDKKTRFSSLRFMSAVFGSIFFFSNLFYFSALRAFLLIFPYEDFLPKYDPRTLKFAFNPSFILGKLIWFFKDPFLNSANILNIENSLISTVFIILLMMSLTVLYLEDIKPISLIRQKLLLFICKYIAVLALIPLSYISVLVSNNSDITYRTIAPLSVFCFIAILIGLESLIKKIMSNFKMAKYWRGKTANTLIFYLISFICMFNVFSTNFYLQIFADNHSLEIRYLKNEIRSIPTENIEHTSRIMILVPKDTSIIENSIHDLNHFSFALPYVHQAMLATAFAEVVTERPALKQLQESEILVFYSGVTELVHEGYKGFNVIKVDNYYFCAILQVEGEFKVEHIENGKYSVFFVARKHGDILKKIDRYLEADDQFKRVLESTSYREFSNIQLRNQMSNEELIIDMNNLRLF